MNRGNVLLLSAVPGVGKTTFGLNFLEEGLKEEQPGIAMVTDFSPEDLISMASAFRYDWEKHVESGLLKVVDCYSHMLGEEGTSQYFVENPENLTRVGRTLREAQDPDSSGRMLLDSASTLLLLSTDVTGVKFLSSISARLKRGGFDSLFILEGGVHDSIVAQRLRYLLDGVLEKMAEVMYQSGFDSGYDFSTAIASMSELSGGQILDEYLRVASVRGWGRFTVVKADLEIGEFIIQMQSSIVEEFAPGSGKVCHIWRGIFAGIVQTALESLDKTGTLESEETRCMADGDPYCEIRVKIDY